MLYADYFPDDPQHVGETFLCRFRMKRKRFMEIVLAVEEYNT
jgi:hypothetical protein